MANFFWYAVRTNDVMSLTQFQSHQGPLKQKFVSVQSANGINLLPLLRAARYFQGLISARFFFLAADVPPHPAHYQGCLSDRGAAHQNAIRTLLATRRTHAQNASCGGRSVPFNSSSRLPLHFTVSLCPPSSPSPKQTEQSIQWHFFGFRWQTNLANDESRPLAGSVWIEWETVAEGGVGMWINRLAEHLTDGIYRRPRRTRELILLGEHTCARFIRLGRKFGSFPKSGGSINQRLQQFGEGTALLRNTPHSCVRHMC